MQIAEVESHRSFHKRLRPILHQLYPRSLYPSSLFLIPASPHDQLLHGRQFVLVESVEGPPTNRLVS